MLRQRLMRCLCGPELLHVRLRFIYKEALRSAMALLSNAIHGQREFAFAFCHPLGFEFSPRLKVIARQKLYLPALSASS